MKKHIEDGVGFYPLRIDLVPLSDLEPAAYNPRKADQQRLDHLTVSLSKLGFILPLYATADGHLLSGHQRLTVATEMGCTHAPVVRVDCKYEELQKLNVVFNRATNDMTPHDTSESLLSRLNIENIATVTGAVKDKDPTNAEQFYPCLDYRHVDIDELLGGIPEEKPYQQGAVDFAHRLHGRGIIMPVVRSASGRILNGVYRLFDAAIMRHEYDIHTYPCVTIPDNDALLAEMLTNMISMRFTLEDQYADMLRKGAFRRPTNKVDALVRVFRFFADGHKNKTATQSLKEPVKFWQNWRRIHGKSVMDFGAGQRRNELIVAEKGIDCLSWEPYPVPWGHPADEALDLGENVNRARPSLTLARHLTDQLLDAVESGKKFDSIFMNAVLNSVPFHKDRMAALAIVHACSSFHTGLFGSGRSVKRKRVDEYHHKDVGADGKTSPYTSYGTFELPYEPNIILGDIGQTPKVQKFHTTAELRRLLQPFWQSIRVWDNGTSVIYECHCPKRVNGKVLREAIEIEFSLPHDDGTLDRVDRALAAFSKRHGIDLTADEYAPEVREPEATSATGCTESA